MNRPVSNNKIGRSSKRVKRGAGFKGLIDLLQKNSEFRFDAYKEIVVRRRVRRRMGLLGISSIADYCKLISKKPEEAGLLASDMLIGVTGFFRDPAVWEDLKREVVRPLIRRCKILEQVRVWTPACSTGQEAYSIAMMLRHEIAASGRKIGFQVFATDIGEESLVKAREGKFLCGPAADIPREYFQESFTCSDDGVSLQVVKELRDHIVFARQNVLADPPFSKIDLVICRNLLIYLDAKVQEKCLSLFHYALTPGGFLLLGNAESAGSRRALFKSLGKKASRIYKKIPLSPETAEVPVPAPKRAPLPHSWTDSDEAGCSAEELRRKLAAARDELQSNAEEYQSTNEELHSANEELQAANEELETSREEMQSLNEELITVNGQLNVKIEEQEKTNDDLNNFFGSTDIPTLFLDGKMRVKRFTPALNRLIKLVPADAGRPIADLSPQKLGPDFLADVLEVLETSSPARRELPLGLTWFIRAVLPYRTSSDRVEGVVATFVDITELKTAEERIKSLAKFPEENTNPVLRVSKKNTILYANPAAKPLLASWRLAVGGQLKGPLAPHLAEISGLRAEKTVEVECGEKIYSFSVVFPKGTDYANLYGRDVTQRKKAEAALSESEARFRTIAEALPVYISISGLADGKILYTNQSHNKAFGFTSEELIGKPAPDLYHTPEERAKLIEAMREQGTLRDLEIWVKKADGSPFWVSASACRITFEGQAAMLGASIDITARKRAEEAVRRSEARWNSAIESFAEGAIIATEDEQVIYWNPAARQMHGFTRPDEGVEPLEKTPVTFQLWTLDGSHLLELDEWPMRRIKRGETVRNLELRIKRPDQGWEKIFSYSGVMVDTMDGERLIFLTCQDITELRRTERALRESDARFRLALKNAPVSVAMQNRDLKFIWAYNQKSAKPEQIIGKFDADIFTPAEATRLFAVKKRVLDEGVEIREQMWLDRPGGRMYLDVCWEPVRDESGKVVGVASATVDLTPQKLAEEALRASEAKYRGLFENIEEMVMVYEVERDEAGRIVERRLREANHAFLRSVGVSSVEEIRGKTSGEIFGKTWSDQHLIAVQKALDTGIAQVQEVYRPESGRHYISSVVRLDNDAYLGTAWDITERKNTEEALRESEAKFRTIFESNSSSVLIIDPDSTISMANDAFCRVFGYTKEETVGSIWTDLVAPEDLARLKEYNRRRLIDPAGAPEQYEFKFIKKGGEIRDCLMWVAMIPDLKKIVASFVDISERKQRERELAGLNRTLTALSNSSKAMIRAQSEPDYLREVCRIIIEDCGHAMAWIGYAENGEGKKVRPVASAGFEEGYLETPNITWDDSERGRGPTGTSIRTGSVSICRNMLTDPHFAPWREQALKRGYASSISLPLKTEAETFGALMIYSREPDPFSDREVELLTELANDLAHGITTLRLRQERDMAEEQLIVRARELAAANKELESFAYSVSHDLRAPLRAMYSFSGMLEEDYRDKLDDTGRDYLARICAGANKMNTLIDDIMSLSQISRHEIFLEDVDLSEMASGILGELRKTSPTRKAEVAVAAGMRERADKRLIEIALTNLLQNAWKYTGKKDGARIEFGAERRDGETFYCVRDNGDGFDMKHADRLFTAFTRLHKEKDFPGTGIGLAIVNRVIARHGGKVWAEGRPGEGACFWFSLPRSPRDASHR